MNIKKRKTSNHRNLATLLKLNIRASVMHTVNGHLEGRLANGLVGVDMYLKLVKNKVKIAFAKIEKKTQG